jgi:uncharacterized protein
MTYRISRLLIIALFVVLLFSLSKITGLYVDWLFFREVGYEAIFTKVLSTEVFTGLAFGAVFLLFFAANILFSSMVNVPTIDIMFMGQVKFPIEPGKFTKIFKIFGIVIAILGGIMSGYWGSSIWPVALTYLNSANTGRVEPIFNNDISFYLFKLPMYEAINGFAGFLIFFTFLLVAVGYLMRGGLLYTGRGFSFVKHAKQHLALLIFLFFIKFAVGFYLDRFEMLYTPHAVLTGAGYADVNARLIVLSLLIPLTVICGIIFCYALLKEKLKIALYPVVGLIAVYILGVAIYPGLLQSFKVAPNEQAMEEPFIKHHISLTKYGYNLDNVQVIPFDVSFNLTSKDLLKNDPTIKNIRLWDEAPLLKTYSQLQQIRTYYRFSGIDTDRYNIGGDYRQIMIAPRELSYNDLPSKSWINEKFVFTHGNGVVMGPVSKISKEGLPEFFIKDIPPSSSANVKIATPEIYFGELTSDYIIVNTKIPEFSYPTAEGNTYTSYKGSGGVRLDSFWKKALFASHFRTAKIVLSSEITGGSKILYNRNVVERVHKIAPFLVLDSDPYVVVSDEGKLYWIIDAYTTSDRLPYSKQLKNWVNYMRNSVKVVVDAYNGGINFYISDPDDVIIKVYASIFPGAFKPISEMPGDLKKHVRYPRDLFRIQTAMYATYHMTDPKVFYNKEDLWEVPVHNDKAMDANYLIMKLPEEKKEEFVILVPYTPAKRDNLAAWFAARCDEQNYGKLLVFTFPRDRLVFGPRQIDARIDQNSYISQQLSLWNQRGSTVIRGKLLIIPIEKSLLYIQPLFLAAEDKGGLPELRRVIVAYENDVVMEENLEQALTALFGGRKVSTPSASTPAQTQKMSIQDLAKEAEQIFERTKSLQKQGDWAGYGENLKKLEQILKQMTGK